MFKINKDYNYYRKCATEVLDCLAQHSCTTLKDIKVIYNLLMGFAYCLDGQKYIYKGKLYNSIEELPKSAHEELLYKARYLQCDDVVTNKTKPKENDLSFKNNDTFHVSNLKDVVLDHIEIEKLYSLKSRIMTSNKNIDSFYYSFKKNVEKPYLTKQ